MTEPTPIDYDTFDPEMAPSDPRWHFLYAHAFASFGKLLEELTLHPSFADAEDLGDYIETLGHLLSFRPHTSREIERDAYVQVYGEKLVAESLELTVSKYPPDNRLEMNEG